MKSRLTLLLALAFACASLLAQNKPEASGAYNCYKNKSQMKRLPELPTQATTAGPHSFDVLKYTLNLDIWHCYTSPYPRNFKASVKVLFKADSVISAIALNAASWSLQVDSVKMNAQSFNHSNDLLTITLDHTYNPGQTGEVMIYYQHKNINDNAFYVSGGFVFTDCEPEGARHWFPCYDSPSDKALFDLTAKVPSNVKLGSNGRLADSTKVADTITYHWISANNVATYLAVITSKVNYNLDIVYYHKVTNPSDSVPIRFYYNTGEDPSGVEAIIADMAEFYSSHWCEHPFEKNGFATLNNLFSWGGMENQTLTSFCPGCWDESLTAHEFAHQWYGDMITCATWADIWLNEGFATWSDAYWNEYSGGYSQYRSAIQGYASQYFSGNPGWPISVPAWATTTPSTNVLFNWSITYCKGACVLHQIRYMLGDTKFFQVLQTYCSDTNYKYKSATIANFNQIVNTVTGENYDWYFNDWIFTANHPVYSNTYQFKNLGSGNWHVDFNTRQIQTNAPFFQMLLNVKIKFTDNSDTVIRVMNDTNDQLFSFFFSKQPSAFYFDPNNEIVLKQGATTVSVNEPEPGGTTILMQNIPNPVSTETVFPFTLASAEDVSMNLFNANGMKVWQTEVRHYTAGSHEIKANLDRLPSGLYIYTLTAGGKTLSGKLTISR